MGTITKIISGVSLLVFAFLFGVMTWSYLTSGEILKIIIGLLMLLVLGGATFVFGLREILYWASRDKKSGE